MDKFIITIPMKDPMLAKTRLSGGLSTHQRQQLAIALFQNTVTFFRQTYPGLPVSTVTASKKITELANNMGTYVIHEPVVNGLNNAATLAAKWAWKNGFHSLFIIPADIPVLIKTEINELLDASIKHDVVIAESTNGGTNALLLSLPNGLTFCYGKNSATAHAQSAKKNALQCYRFCPTHLSQDIDTLSDLAALSHHLTHYGLMI